METWTPLSTPAVHAAYAEQATRQAPPVGDLFRQALAAYSAARHPQPAMASQPMMAPQPVMAPPAVHLVPAESASLFSMFRGYLRGRASRA